MKHLWWKLGGIVMVIISLVWGFIVPVPALDILNETIRNLFFHVPMWFTMILLLLVSTIYSIMYLARPTMARDAAASEFTKTALFFGLMGILTGMLWARYTWGGFWSKDPKLNGVAIGMLVYLAYMVLRAAVEEPEKKARVSAVYNVFAFPVFFVLVAILPRIQGESLHPGAGGNPGFNTYDLDATMRPVFYLAVTGWIITGVWISNIRIRLKKLEIKHEDSL